MWQSIDRRQFPRSVYKCLITLRRGKARHSIPTQTENIGTGGVCVMINECLDLFSEVSLVITLADSLPPLRCHGRVVWSIRRSEIKKQKPHLYDTGIEFTKIRDDDRKRIADAISEILKKGETKKNKPGEK